MEVEVKIKGLMIDPISNLPIVILKDPNTDSVLPIWVGIFEANAIALQIESISTPRPMTHDLVRTILDTLHAKVEKVVITELKESTFYALIHVRYGDVTLHVDARPSDAIAIALRTESPIFVEEKVISQAKKVDMVKEAGESERLRKWLENLDPDDLGKYEM
jgi:bifunctional DNase/RNase